jgi:hypothetical protein
LGWNTDAERGLKQFAQSIIGSDAKGDDSPWHDAIASEFWQVARTGVPPKRLHDCRATRERPHLDGELEDPLWQDAKIMVCDSVVEGHSTKVRWSFDTEFLYVAIQAENSAGTPEPEPNLKRTRDMNLSGFDRVELLFDLDRDYQTYFRMAVDCRGMTTDDCCGDLTWNPKWYVAHKRNAKGWTAEIAIPLMELSASAINSNSLWCVNATRITPGVGVAGWSKPTGVTPKPEGMGLLRFEMP